MNIGIDRQYTFPLLISPVGNANRQEDLASWLADPNSDLTNLLAQYGALLFRGFDIKGSAEFEAICQAGTPGLVDYTGGGSPRSRVAGKVYTSTEYAANQQIPLHCEYTYFKLPPPFIWFYCETPAASGGETPIGDMQRVLEQLDVSVVERFSETGVRYIYNLHGGDGFGRGWREAFDTNDQTVVEAWLEKQLAAYHWKDDGSLSVNLTAPAVRTHDCSGITVWGNQAVNWHVAQFPVAVRTSLRKFYKDENHLPKHAMFGDGSPIPDAYIEHILDTLRQEESTFVWECHDILLCDNQRIAHGRRPFQGDRRILVTLA